MKNFRLATTLTLLAFAWHQTQATMQVPAGFEELVTGQITWIDVSLYGKSLGLFQAKVDLEKIRFIKPEELADAVSEKYNNAADLHALILKALQSPLARNGNLSCSSTDNAPGCGYIDTKTLAVIYDDNAAKANLVLDKKYLPVKPPTDNYYEAIADSHNALIHQQNVNFVADQDYQSASVQGNGSLGVTENGYVNVDWNWQGQRYKSDNYQRADVNNAYFRQDLWKRVYLQGGLMDSRDIFTNAGGNINLSQLPIGKIKGLRAGSTMAWVNQENASQGTPVTVFLSQDSRVDAYRNGQLLSSFYLKAGAQVLDTRSFPSGSYVVTLNIYENNQLVRTQTVPYTGTGTAPINTFQWFLQAGNVVNDSGRKTDDNNRVLQGGVRIPITQSLSFTAGSTLLNNVSYWEGAADWTHGFSSGFIDGVMTSRASYLYGTDGSRGNIQQINYNDGFSLSLYRTDMTSPDCSNAAQKRYSYSSCYKSVSTMVSVPVSKWYASLGYSDSQNEGRYVTRNQLPENDPEHTGVPWDQVWTTRSRSKTWQAGLSRYFTPGGYNINTSINAFIRNDSAYSAPDKGVFVTVNLSFANSRGGSDMRSSSSLGVRYQNSRMGDEQLGYDASYSHYTDNSGDNEVGASMSGLNTRYLTASTWARAGGQYGDGSLTLSDSYRSTDNSHAPSSSGNYNSSFVIDRRGLYWGRWGDGTPSSAITVGVDSGPDDDASAVNVSLDSGGQADVMGNSRALFTVPGYRQATFNITESAKIHAGASSEISRGAGTQTVFMVPGKVYKKDISVSARYTWLGKMTDENNQPLTGGIPLNVMSWSPMEDGGFTMETERPIKDVFVMRRGEFWKCEMKVKAVRDVVRFVGTTKCEDTPMASLPKAEQKQVTLMADKTSGGDTETAKAD